MIYENCMLIHQKSTTENDKLFLAVFSHPSRETLLKSWIWFHFCQNHLLEFVLRAKIYDLHK